MRQRCTLCPTNSEIEPMIPLYSTHSVLRGRISFPVSRKRDYKELSYLRVGVICMKHVLTIGERMETDRSNRSFKLASFPYEISFYEIPISRLRLQLILYIPKTVLYNRNTSHIPNFKLISSHTRIKG